jgi:subtilisin family serine protease
MKQKIIFLLSCYLLITCAGFGQKIYKDYIDGEIYIKLKKEVPYAFDTLQRSIDIQAKLPFLLPFVNRYNITKADAAFYFSKSDVLKRTFRLHISNSKMIDALIKELSLLPQVEYAEKVPLCKVIYTPNDLGSNTYDGQYGLYNINAQSAWDVARGNHSTVVAIVDNAEDINHVDLTGNVVSARDVSDNDNDPTPPASSGSWVHGTHTSGTACASTNNTTGVASIGFGCGLMAVKTTPNTGDGGFIYNGYEGISWAATNGASVISCSWGSSSSSTTNQNVITDAYNHNVLVVASAGNNGNANIQYPAGYDHVLSVVATDINDQKASFSTYGSWVDVCAPGVSILSTLPGNNYGYLSGTSMAAPLVAGLCGLVRSVNPSLSVDQVVNVIESTCDNIDALNPGYGGLLGSGRINAYNAVESALPCNPSVNLGTGVYTVPKTESSGSITSGNTIPGGSAVVFDAATLVELVPGFHAFEGSTFRAYIDGCGGSKFFSSNVKNKTITNNIESKNTSMMSPVNAADLKGLRVFPNPSSAIVHLEFTTGKPVDNAVIRVYNTQMQHVKDIKPGNLAQGKQNITVNLSNLASGMYFIIVQLPDEQLKAKVSLIK